ncbi:MAG: prephenate dehydratase [Candidatus Syntrophoarchaeum caldarius]|uniref:prephenate dehydratase n=1 Tax=Candidatus Syntropharchaeum caldarium TaxID=1838285 RepID=A0A1F2PAU2_9EURY|nr:MAG: prephenate dehydratase [Candidatus Syntrophoarchaeum caldarius]
MNIKKINEVSIFDMIKIAALGPANTFSELAAIKYGKTLGRAFSVELYPTIGKVFDAVGAKCSCAVLPIENMAEGYVSAVLDHLIHSDLFIVHELLLPIQFTFAANCSSLDQVEKVYAQFVTQGQCERFLDKMGDMGVSVITTQSNGTSLEQLQKRIPNEAAIVPSFAVKPGDFPLVIPEIADRSNNQTRFITIASHTIAYDPARKYKTTLLIVESVDRPGMLSDILSSFSIRNINLVSIMSRPTKEMLGRYHFFIDVEGHAQEARIREALAEIERENTIRMLGSYVVAQQEGDL